MYRGIVKKNMEYLIDKDTKFNPYICKDDILPRISCGVNVKYAQKEYKVIGYYDYRHKLILQDLQQPECELIVEMERVKPLLRPMDSMTRQEKDEYHSLLDGVANQTKGVWEVTEWLNDNSFDYKDLIGQGLAEEI